MISYSILICAYNQKDILRETLDTLRRQIKNPKAFEIIIADDCSTDGTDDFVRKLRYPIFLKYVRAESNQGRARNRDRGFKKVMGQWVICLDGDMMPEPDFIEAHVRARAEYPDSVCLGGLRFPTGRAIAPWQKYLFTRGRITLGRGERLPGKYFTSDNFSILKETYDKLSGFDLTFEGWGGEDTDFGIRLEQSSIPIINIPEASCFHYVSKGLGDVIKQYADYGQNGYSRLLKKHPGITIFEKGWILGLPDSTAGFSKRLAAFFLFPLRSRLALALLRMIADMKQGAFLSDSLFDWLFYGHLALGYRKRKE